MKRIIFIILAGLLCLSGCGADNAASEDICRIVLAEREGYTAEAYTGEVIRNGELRFALKETEGWSVTGCDYEGYQLLRDRDSLILVLPDIRYTKTVHVTTDRNDAWFVYDANGGTGETVTIYRRPSHLRLNTAVGDGLFSREGYTLTGWNTEPDGSGTPAGLGSRISADAGTTLYAQWSKWTDASCFTWEIQGDGAALTGYRGDLSTVSVPAVLEGRTVLMIREGAFADASCDKVILPETLQYVEDGAFTGCSLSELWISDSIRSISDYAFTDCDSLKTLHINAVKAPCYAGTYFAAFADKLDRLISISEQKKIVLFSGSSARFGYDCAAIDGAFPDYAVVNMGVFAYTNALPQLEIIRSFMKQDDILLHSPEFDAAQRQFCTSANLDAAFFNMIEGNYDAAALLDLRNYGQVFNAFLTFLRSRDGMDPLSYDLSPSDFDEEGNPVGSSSYNKYGDYTIFRPNSADETPIYGLPVRYTAEAFPEQQFILPLNRTYQSFLDRGIRVYFTYAPRNRKAVSEDSTEQAVSELDRYFRSSLCVPVISEIEDSLVSGIYLFGTDNHLSTEGAAIRTEQIIEDIGTQLKEEEDG